MSSVYRDMPPPAAQRVSRLWAWIATHDDGSEGIISADLPFEGVSRHIPLLSSQRATALALRPVAERVRDEAMRQSNRRVTIALRAFSADDPQPTPIEVNWSDASP